MKSKELFPGVFSRHAEAYRRRLESSLNEGHAASRQALLEALAMRPGERVLDLACGPGTLTLRLAEAVGPGGMALGVDLAPGMIEVARREADARGLKAEFRLMDVEALDLPDAGFDAAACGHGLQFCPDLNRALREARRVLKAGGRLAATVPVDDPRTQRPVSLMRVERELLPPAPEAPDRSRTLTIVEDLELLRLAAWEAGFAEARTQWLEEHRIWANASVLVDSLSSWWATAVRLEQLDGAGRARFREAALAALEQEFGDGPVAMPGAAHLLYAVA